MKMKMPEIGDTFVIRGVITGINGQYFQGHPDAAPGINQSFYVSQISEIIPKPWEPKVGEKMKYGQSEWVYEYRGQIDGRWAVKDPNSEMYFAIDKESFTKHEDA